MDPLVVAVVALVGLVVGALINILVVRIPREETLSGWPRCTRCGRSLAWWQVLPVLGWLAQGGRGRCCGKRIAWIFPLVEVLMAGSMLVFAWRYGLGVRFAYLAFVVVVLLLTGAIDWLHRSIYTFFILVPTVIALVVAQFVPGQSFLNAIVGMLVAGVIFIIMFALARFLFPAKSAPFGLGDVYLGMFLGAALGLTHLLVALFYGVVLAGVFSAILVVLKQSGRPNVPEYISYGTFLCIGALAYMLYETVRV